MLKRLIQMMVATALLALVVTPFAMGQNLARDYNNDDVNQYRNAERVRIDRYLDVELWTNHPDEEYYEGDDIVIKFRVNRDAYVAIYSVDTRGRVNMLFPADPQYDNYVQGDVTYSIPGARDDFDLVVTGPEGVESIQAIASRERFPIPDWYPNSGLIFDWDDRFEYMDHLNDRYFVRFDGQRFAYDRASLYINEWEEYYFRPVYDPYYPSWTVAGNLYIDYPIGGSVYVNGIYWGCAPLYIPRLYVGWNTFSIYDSYGYGWESDVYINRYHTVVLDRSIVHPRAGFSSKYKDVRYAGYRDPVANGYPNYKKRAARLSTNVDTSPAMKKGSKSKNVLRPSHKFSRGDAKTVKTERGWESSVKRTRTTTSKSSQKQMTTDRQSKKFDGTTYRQSKSNRSSTGSSKVSRRTVRSQSNSKSSSRVKAKRTVKSEKNRQSVSQQKSSSKSKSRKIESKSVKKKSESSRKYEKKNNSKKSNSSKSAPKVKKQSNQKKQPTSKKKSSSSKKRK